MPQLSNVDSSPPLPIQVGSPAIKGRGAWSWENRAGDLKQRTTHPVYQRGLCALLQTSLRYGAPPLSDPDYKE